MRMRAFYAGVGIENTWIAQEDLPGKRLLDVFLQMDHYGRWRQDLQLARDLGINAIRYSVPWYRSEPSPGRRDWDWIAGPLQWLAAAGITAIVDLLHYGTPTWMEGGLLHPSFPERLADYAAAFARRFAGVVDHYTPVNEPQTAASMMGWHGAWPPYMRGISGWLALLEPAARAVVLCTQALRAAAPGAVLVSADCDFTPPFDTVAAAAGMPPGEAARTLEPREQLIHETFAGMLAYGAVPEDHPSLHAVLRLGFPEKLVAWFTAHAARPDIAGFNYYPEFARTPYGEAGRILFERLRVLHGILGLPVYVTETSGGRDGTEKAAWIAELGRLRDQARAVGLPLRGVNWWPLYDTVQWFYRDNGRPLEECIVPGGWNNGLYVTGPGLARVPTAAVGAWREFCARQA